jgi:hypothetical protein
MTLSKLRDLIFRIAYQEIVQYPARFYVPIFTNSTVTNFGFDSYAKRLSFNVTGASGVGFCNVTIPRAMLYASHSDWIVSVDGNQSALSSFNVTENAEIKGTCFMHRADILYEYYPKIEENTHSQVAIDVLAKLGQDEVLCLVHFRFSIAHAAAILSQSEKAVAYLEIRLNKGCELIDV